MLQGELLTPLIDAAVAGMLALSVTGAEEADGKTGDTGTSLDTAAVVDTWEVIAGTAEIVFMSTSSSEDLVRLDLTFLCSGRILEAALDITGGGGVSDLSRCLPAAKSK